MSGLVVQRWRVVYRRQGAAAMLAQRDASAMLEAAIAAGDLPVAIGEGARPRPRLMFGPAVPQGIVAEEELLDILLAERVVVRDTRTALERSLPPDHVLVGLHDVWIGAPSLTASVVAADYRVLLGKAEDEALVAGAIDSLMGAERIMRGRERAGRESTYDLRPLIDRIRVVRGDGGAILEMRLLIDQQRGTGRPDVVLTVLREGSGMALEPVLPIVRGRLHLSPA